MCAALYHCVPASHCYTVTGILSPRHQKLSKKTTYIGRPLQGHTWRMKDLHGPIQEIVFVLSRQNWHIDKPEHLHRQIMRIDYAHRQTGIQL